MIRYRIRDLLALQLGDALHLDEIARTGVPSISTDSRTHLPGEVFLALRGESYDGHAFVESAFLQGAPCCIVDQRWYRSRRDLPAGLPLLVVPDTTRAYGDIARAYRARFSLPVLLITGSNGKTTTREMTVAMLSAEHRVLHTAGNLNNHIGLPRTVLTLRATHDIAVLEAGTNQPGDIAYLCSIAGHTHALVTNVGRAHLEKLGSREGIAEEKGGVYASLPEDGVAFLNADEPLLSRQIRRRQTRVTFGSRKTAMFRVTDITLDGRGCATFFFHAAPYLKKPMKIALGVSGRHNVFNAAAALCAGFHFGCASTAMKEALREFRAYDMRSEVIDIAGITVINDTYNANPDSVVAAIDTLAAMRCDGVKVAVLGDMLELGAAARAEHRLVGDYLAGKRIPYVFTLGTHAALIAPAQTSAVHAQHFPDRESLAAALHELLQPGDLLLIKGSRGMRMEELVSELSRQRSSTN
jgi:UDP-N-acetylmuramoyl-tripeptide--D-alanyl-D-alanine ligase